MGLLPELLLAPLLVAVSILAGRRWGERVSGLVSSFPAVVGPVLLIAAKEHGASFTASTADGTLFGLATLAVFMVTYAKLAGRVHWSVSLTSAWVTAVAVGIPIRWLAGYLGFPAGLLVSTISLYAAYAAMPPGIAPPARAQPEGGGAQEIMLQMGLTAALVGGLAVAAAQLGPTVGGILAGLPVLASVLAVRIHRRDGRAAVVGLLRGMLKGMPSFVGFCAVVALLITPVGTAWAFSVAAVVAIALQITALDRGVLVRVARGALAARRT
jgi:hypothetical protein